MTIITLCMIVAATLLGYCIMFIGIATQDEYLTHIGLGLGIMQSLFIICVLAYIRWITTPPESDAESPSTS